MRWLAGILLSLLVGAGTLFLLATDDRPLVSRGETISPTAVAQARRLLFFNDPRFMRSGEQRQVAVPASLLDEGINYLASRATQGRGALIVGERAAEVRLSVAVPLSAITRYVNLRATIPEGDGAPRIATAAIGRLPLPAGLANLALESAVRLAGHEKEWRLARGAMRRLTFDPARQQVLVAFVWEPAILDQARAVAISADDLARLRRAQENLSSLLAHRSPQLPMRLVDVLQPMLTTRDGQSLDQRRAALLILAAHLSERSLAALIPEAGKWPRPRPVVLMLRDRQDSAQHFVISAALAAWAGEPVADAIGLYKELEDARHGSGFSFADLAADRAGTRFGELAMRQPERLDAQLATRFTDEDLLPPLDGLPEYLPQREFLRRFGGPGTPAYRNMLAEIDRRLATLPLYR